MKEKPELPFVEMWNYILWLFTVDVIMETRKQKKVFIAVFQS